MIAEVIDRLGAEVAELSGRVDGAAAFARLMDRKSWPQAPVAAFVLPLGLQGGAANAAAGAFDQMVRESIGVLLMVNSADPAGEAALARLEPLIRDIIAAIAGWAPADTVGVFELTRGNLVDPGLGRLAYQLEFAIADQLRILS